MNFRQRVAWMLVAVYLSLSCVVVYYIFDINDGYSSYALEHVVKEHDGQVGGTSQRPVWSFAAHLMDVPLVVWFFILVLPYLQVFSMLLACTKPEPRLSMAYVWPFYVYIKCKRVVWRTENLKSVNSPVPNGHPVLVT